MNEQEAKDMLQAKLTCLELDSDIEGCDGDCMECEYSYAQGTIREQREVFKMAIEALEKKIPKKVKKFPHFSIHTRPMIFYITHCPVCDHVVDEYEDDHIYPRTRNEYCNRCGQKLDWKVEE